MSMLGLETSSRRFDTSNTINAASKLGQGSLRGPGSLGPPQAYKLIMYTKGPCPLLSDWGWCLCPLTRPHSHLGCKQSAWRGISASVLCNSSVSKAGWGYISAREM